ncbi:hypothetical protein PF005_g23287 [Phytophthora fragariae]|uniref:Uncharacterized protein n=1 Tax=Phytophthora fragariae TaxID=53985 RepID=A0A6A3RVA6_9STRA|nr:hypothetical protein PF003_g23473 [Phytophthora fragariae]KAE8925764.1 hypothetical protein PF009_g24032 [Phytophthora fragariae]KAE8964787.1 hypothetical protein PF011_g28539 [Phytophthora fragariae]KAE9062759.1 hypothetical protein PF010_g29269 [Phytophthora fragariae]KAE9081747.1 hypothetical protein PF007_g22540 [Phytophthora fragariae]
MLSKLNLLLAQQAFARSCLDPICPGVFNVDTTPHTHMSAPSKTADPVLLASPLPPGGSS